MWLAGILIALAIIALIAISACLIPGLPPTKHKRRSF